MFKFLHTADLHLDSPLHNLARYEDAPQDTLREATRRALDTMVELALEEEVAFVLIAGDLYDGDCRDFNTPQHLRKKLAELGRQGINVYIVQGNHDAESVMKRASKLTLPKNVHTFSVTTPETVELEQLAVAIHGQGYAKPTEDRDLSLSYPAPRQGWLNIGLLHTNCGDVASHGNYAPSSLSVLVNFGYDYWALGHIHQRQLLHREPWVVYPGNLQGRHIKEVGDKGCTLVTVEDRQIVQVDHRACDVLRWVQCHVDASDYQNGAEVLAAVERSIESALATTDERPIAARVSIAGATQAHKELAIHRLSWEDQLRDRILGRFNDSVWLEKVKLETRIGFDLQATLCGDDPLAQLIRTLASSEDDDKMIEHIRLEVAQLQANIPTDTRLEEPALDEKDVLTKLLAEARELLIPLILDNGGIS